MSAADRREQIVGLAVEEFAAHGLHGTSTEAIARRAGVSQPYLFRLFGTKKALFLACSERCFARITAAFRDAAATVPGATPAERLAAMGAAYIALLSDRTLLRGQLQLYAACEDPEIQAAARPRWRGLVEEVQRLSGASPEELRAFMAQGMLRNVAAALNLLELADSEPWVGRLLWGGDAPTAHVAREE